MLTEIKSGETMLRSVVAFCFVLLLMVQPARAMVNGPVTLTLGSNHDVTPPVLPLSHDDLLWLVPKRTLTIAVYGRESPPLSMNSEAGRYYGLNADYLLLLKRALRLDVVVKRYPDEQQAFAALQAGSVDLALTPPNGAENLKLPFIASLPLVQGYPTLATRQAEVMKPLHDDSAEVTVAITRHYPPEAFIKAEFPRAKIISFADDYQALASLANLQSDYYFGNNLTTSFIIARDFYQTLRMVKFWRAPQTSNVFVALDSQQRLLDIINLFISSLSEPVHERLAQAWINQGNFAFVTKPLNLTVQEQRWQERHRKLRVLINPYYAPFSMVDENQEIRGLIGDILNLIHLQTGLIFEPVIVNSNTEMVNLMRKGEWDILPTATYSPEREDEIAFTHPFYSTPFVIVTRASAMENQALKPGMKVAIPAYHTLLEKLKAEYPGIQWVETENTSAALSMLNQGEIDAAISTQLASRFIIEHYYPDQLAYQAIPDQPPAQIAFAVPRGSYELQGILNAALDAIPPKEMLSLAGKWVKLPDVKIGTWNLYSRPFYLVIVLATLLVLGSLLWGGYLLRAIRKRKASQAALEYQLVFRQTLSNSIPVPVYVISLNGELESYNSAFDSFFTPERREAMHYSLFDRRHPLADVFAAVQPDIQQGLKPDVVIPCQLVLNNGKEERQILHWLTLCRLPANMPPTLICGWQDITESRQLMKALQVEKDKAIDANQAKSTFLASMSHEIRTPISAIMGFLELLTTHRQSPQEDQEAIQLAYATAQSLLGLIGDVLDMEKIESGHFEIAPEWVNLESLITATVSSFEGLATQKNLRLSVDYQFAKKEEALWLDPQAVKQVLANLLSNAIKFTVEGGVSVIVQTQALGEGKTRLTLSVKDSGAGMNEQEQQQLFKPFSQTEGGKQQGGSGLGLKICRELVEHMAGEITLASQPGLGTTITVTLVTEVSAKVSEVSPMSKPLASPPKALRIIIADDHPTNRLLLRRQLDSLGYHVDEVIDGVQALALIKQQSYDLLITDLNMPNMDGIALTSHVREFNQQIIIWGLTANAQAKDRERALASGMDLCLFKPIDLPLLEAELLKVGAPLTAESPSLGEFIDLAKLERLSLGDSLLMREMLEQSQQENAKDLAAALQALHQQEWVMLQRYLHRINGTTQILGATGIHQLSETLENALEHSTDNAMIEEGMLKLEQQLQALNAAMMAYIKELKR